MLRSFLIIFIGCIAPPLVHSQSITVSLPSTGSTFSCSVSGTTISGFSCPFTVGISSAPSIYSVEYDVDGEVMIPSGIIYSAPYSGTFNTFYVGNGQHSVFAIARDALNNTLATSVPVSFSVENDMPQNLPGTNCGPFGGGTACTDITVTTGLIAPLTLVTTSPYTANVVSIQGTAPAIVGSAVTGTTNSGTSASISMSATSANAVFVYVYWASSSATMSMADGGSDTFTCLTAAQNATIPASTRWCYVASWSGGTHTITASVSGSAIYIAMSGTQVSGSSATPLDQNVNLVNTGGGFPQTGIFLPTSAPKLILAGFGWEGANPGTAGKGYTLQAALLEMAVESASYSTLGGLFSLAGFSVTVNGPVATQAHGVNLFVDGMNIGPQGTPSTSLAVSSTTSATVKVTLDTSYFLGSSGSPVTHKIVISASGGTSCVTCGNGSWTWMGGYENSFSFVNSVLPSQLLMSAREVTIVSGGPASNCGGGSTCTLTGTIQNTDASTTTATLTGCVSANTSVVTISGTCTINHVAAGVTSITATESGGKTRVTWVYDLPANTIPHFSNTGTILSSYSPTNSFWHVSLFGGNVLTGANAPLYTAAQACTDTLAGGYTTAETSSPAPPIGTEAAWSGAGGTVATWIATYVTSVNTTCPSLKFHLISDSYFRGTPQMFPAVYGPGGLGAAGGGYETAYSTPAYQYFIQQIANTHLFIANSGVDEIGLSWGGSPLLGLATSGIFVGTNGFTSLVGNGSTCTIISGTGGYPTIGYTGARRFIITGSSSSALDYNGTTNSNLFQQNGAGVFPCTFNGTAPNTTQIHPYVSNTFDSTGVACSTTNGTLGSCSSGSSWIHYNFAQIARTWNTNVTGYPPMSWPCAAGCSSNTVSEWQGGTLAGNGPLGDYGEYYYAVGGALYLPSRVVLTDVINSFANGWRTNAAPYLNLANPFLMETAGTAVDYTPQGYPVQIASCIGNTITTVGPHGLSSPFLGSSRLWISGSSGGICDSAANSGLYVIATPTSTTIQVANALFSLGSTTSSGSGSISFVGGPTYATGTNFTTLTTGSSTAIGSGGGINGVASLNCPGNPIPNYRGLYFTGSGWSNSYFNTTKFWLNWNGVDSCTRTPRFYEVPNFASSTGGTAFIVPDNNYIRGRSWQSNAEVGQWYMFADKMMCMMLGCAGDRQYSFGASAEVYDRTGLVNGGGGLIGGSSFDTNSFNSNVTFQQTNAQTLQAGVNPHWDYARSFTYYTASTAPHLIGQRLAKFNFQPRLPSPDYGQFFEAAARTGSYGNILEIQSFAEAPQSCTANLTPYLVAGQPIIRMSATWAGIEPIVVLAAGTTSDTMTCQSGEFRAYIFANNEAAEVQQPIISLNLADVANATDILVQFSYSPLAFNTQSVQQQLLYQTFDCETGTCKLAVDRQIGVLYYRFVYRDTTGKVLATSDVQTL